MDKQNINQGAMLSVGSMLRGNYRIDSYLSSGGFGNTYIATDVELEEVCAIKEFFMKGVTQRERNNTTVSVSNADNKELFEEQLQKFKKEARRMRKLKNPHIVAVHALFEENGTAYYVMDYIDGENLAEKLKRTQKPLPEKEVMAYLPQMLDALDTIHQEGIWHLDLKPANIMVDRNGNVSLIDFGASKQRTNKGGATSTAVSYTNGFAPREQMEQNQEKFGPWTDIYALGATLYNLLANQRPPLPSDIDDDRSPDKHLALPLPEDVSEKARTLILHLMTTNRLDRPQSVKEVTELMAYIQEHTEDIEKETEEEQDFDTLVAQRKPKREGQKKTDDEKEKAAKEKAEREKAAKEKAEREKAAKEKAEREKAERERAAKEKAEREKAERERAANGEETEPAKRNKWRVPLIAGSALAAVALAAVFMLPGKNAEEPPVVSQETVEQVRQEMSGKSDDEVKTNTADVVKTTTEKNTTATATPTEKDAPAMAKTAPRESPKKTSSTTPSTTSTRTTTAGTASKPTSTSSSSSSKPSTSSTTSTSTSKDNQGDYNTNKKSKYNLDDNQNTYNSGKSSKYGL